MSAAIDSPRWQPYPAYKPSGVEWLSEIPAHWKLDRLKWTVTSCTNGVWGEAPDGISDIVCVRVADFDRIQFRVSLDNPTMRSVSSQRTRRMLKQGDLLLEKSGGGELQPVGAVMLYDWDTPAVCSNFIARMPVANGFDARFLVYLHAALYSVRVHTRSIKQTTGIQNLDSFSYLSELGCLPPIDEQRTIAAFLDRETTRLDALIAKKQRLIELLQEQRTALISQVVTKGLEPNTPMKYSGAEWLGEIPAHWTASAFKRVASISYGLVLELDRTETQGTNIISLPNVTKDGRLLLDDVPLTRLTEADKKSLLLQKGDLLFNWRNGSADHVGKTAYFDGDGEYTHVSFLLRLRFDGTKHDSHYFHYFLNNLRNTGFFNASKGMVNKTYNQSELGRLVVMVPPLADQQAVAKFLDQATAKIDALIAKTTDAIERLREYRTALISAAVTGKIDVREEVH